MTDGENKLVAGELEAIFLPRRGMLGASFRHRGEELLRRLENLEAAAAKGSTAGIPLLYPWDLRTFMRWGESSRASRACHQPRSTCVAP